MEGLRRRHRRVGQGIVAGQIHSVQWKHPTAGGKGHYGKVRSAGGFDEVAVVQDISAIMSMI